MKKIILALCIFAAATQVSQAQVLNKLKEKTQAAAKSSADRSTDKVVDRAVNKSSDNLTDKALNKADEKIKNLFKKKNKVRKQDESTKAHQDSTVTSNQ